MSLADCQSLPLITPLPSNVNVVCMAHDVGLCSCTGLRTSPKGFQLYEGPLTALYKTFWSQPGNFEVDKGGDIKFDYITLQSTCDQLYFFKQYAYLPDRIDAFRAHDTSKEWKDCVIVTGTPGIGKAFYLPSPSD